MSSFLSEVLLVMELYHQLGGKIYKYIYIHIVCYFHPLMIIVQQPRSSTCDCNTIYNKNNWNVNVHWKIKIHNVVFLPSLLLRLRLLDKASSPGNVHRVECPDSGAKTAREKSRLRHWRKLWTNAAAKTPSGVASSCFAEALTSGIFFWRKVLSYYTYMQWSSDKFLKIYQLHHCILKLYLDCETSTHYLNVKNSYPQ